jgi:cytochrome c5
MRFQINPLELKPMKKSLSTASLMLALSLCGLAVFNMNLLPSSHAQSLTVLDKQSASDPAPAIYRKNCASCHDRGVMGAPKPGDLRLQKDINILVENSIKGIGNMPARGHASFLLDDEVRSVVEYMMSPR